GRDPGNDLVLPHLRVEIGEEVSDLSGNLGTDLDRGDGIQRPGGPDGGVQRATLDRGGPEGGLAPATSAIEVQGREGARDRGGGEKAHTPCHLGISDPSERESSTGHDRTR